VYGLSIAVLDHAELAFKKRSESNERSRRSKS
jgi:hypothetical protein